MTTDDELVERLRRLAAAVEPVPEAVTEAARAAFLTRRLDEEIAMLLRDSALSASAVRGTEPGPRLLSYEVGDVSLELELELVGRFLTLRGLALGTVGDAEVDAGATGPHVGVVDDHGWFTVEALPPGPLRVRVHTAAGAVVTTGWIDG